MWENVEADYDSLWAKAKLHYGQEKRGTALSMASFCDPKTSNYVTKPKTLYTNNTIYDYIQYYHNKNTGYNPGTEHLAKQWQAYSEFSLSKQDSYQHLSILVLPLGPSSRTFTCCRIRPRVHSPQTVKHATDFISWNLYSITARSTLC